MNTVFYLLSLFLTVPLGAQSGNILRVEPAEVSKEIVVDNLDEHFEDVTSIVVTNNSTRTIQLVREAVTGRQPRSWNYRTIDRVSRTTPYVLSESEQRNGRHLPLAPGQSATFYIILKPDGVTGKGITELRFSDLTIPGTVLASASVSTTLTQRPTAQPEQDTRPAPTTVRLYPNPAAEKFFVESPPTTRIGRVEVTNTLGRQILSFAGESGPEGYDIRKLPDGLYLISIYDEGGKKIKTLRLLHRQFGA
ncbi:T9SS type A sorting domain-containing protein [Lewinella sp. JB7]|uniref:T9SS type A sorting domain-containing protein n=1 Tax=Lewinella sp. JB7 TaxID=2962887 RepID=UPI0020C9C013|nr:T9SS type A sorting domain-containing protein [Lewinella sp. JB7]MCP9237675.1 T9SS type A sorting domain-containing protein [Lewinella sp. JB7]